MSNHSKVYQEVSKLKISPATAKTAALKEIEKMETDPGYAEKVRFNPLQWRIQRAFDWDNTPDNFQKLWPQLTNVQIKGLKKQIIVR